MSARKWYRIAWYQPLGASVLWRLRVTAWTWQLPSSGGRILQAGKDRRHGSSLWPRCGALCRRQNCTL